jgi:hypothetical protein
MKLVGFEGIWYESINWISQRSDCREYGLLFLNIACDDVDKLIRSDKNVLISLSDFARPTRLYFAEALILFGLSSFFQTRPPIMKKLVNFISLIREEMSKIKE